MKISFLNPIIKKIDPKIVNQETMDIGENIGIGLLTSYLRKKGFEVQIVYGSNEQNSIIQTIAQLNEFKPDIVGITVMSQTYPLFQKYAKLIKRDIGSPIAVGGILPSILQEQFLKEFDLNNQVDYLIYGDGEETVFELLNHFAENKKKDQLHEINGLIWRDNGTIIKNKHRNLIIDLDNYPFSARDYAPNMLSTCNNTKNIPALRMITSRGCNSQCLYCHISEYYNSMNRKVWRSRSPQNIVNEIIYLKEKFNVKHFLFSDDNFLGYGLKGIERAKDFATILLKNKIDITFCMQTRIDQIDTDTIYKMRDAGLVGIDVGIETISNNSLDFFKKRLSGIKILKNIQKISRIKNLYLGIYMLNIHPLSSIKETYDNYRFLDSLGYFDVEDEDKEIYRKLIATQLEITKYTRMYSQLIKLNLIGHQFYDNEVMYKFKFQDKEMDAFYLRVLRYIRENGLFGFKNFLLKQMDSASNSKNN